MEDGKLQTRKFRGMMYDDELGQLVNTAVLLFVLCSA